MKGILKLSLFAILFVLISSCSDFSTKNIKYNTVKSMPGYGYVEFDFSKSKEIDYGRQFVQGKASYSVYYVGSTNSLLVTVDDAEFDGRILKAYIPYMKGYSLRSIKRYFWYPLYQCGGCKPEPYGENVTVYVINSSSEARCDESTYENYHQYEHMSGCNDMGWVKRAQKSTGSVLITPHFYSGFKGMFTPYLKPAYSTGGA